MLCLLPLKFAETMLNITETFLDAEPRPCHARNYEAYVYILKENVQVPLKRLRPGIGFSKDHNIHVPISIIHSVKK